LVFVGLHRTQFNVCQQASPKTGLAVAAASADRRTLVLALIGNLICSWSNNESLFIYVLMILLRTDEASAAVVFATLNTTRARLDLIQRLAKIRVTDKALAKSLTVLIEKLPAARMGDKVVEAGPPNSIAAGCPTVMIGG